MKKPTLAGIDVSANSVAVALEIQGRPACDLEFANDAAGHRQLCRRLQRARGAVKVCLEASGIYHVDLALALHATPGVEVMVANPRATKDFSRAQMNRTKTDAVDARSLLEFVRRMPFRPWVPPSKEVLALRAIARRIAALTIMTGQERNRQHAQQHCRELPAILNQEAEAHRRFLAESAARLADEALAIIAADPWLQKRFDHLVSVRGIAKTSAVAILGELAALPPDMTARQWVAHAGIDPRHFDSGTSVSKPTRISRTGNSRLRAALYMPALVAVRYEPSVAAFYQQLLARGKKPMQAIVAVMRKLLHAIWGMFHHDSDFAGEKFYYFCH